MEYFKALSQHLPGVSEENQKNFNHNCRVQAEIPN